MSKTIAQLKEEKAQARKAKYDKDLVKIDKICARHKLQKTNYKFIKNEVKIKNVKK